MRIALLEFLREARQNLRLRFISVERNGFGTAAFDDSLAYADYAGDVEARAQKILGKGGILALCAWQD
jgi:hypothetical protein